VQACRTNLKQLAATPMGAAVPDLARSLEALRTLRLAQDRPAGRAADRPFRPVALAVRVLFWFLLLAAAAVGVALAARLTTGYALFVAPPIASRSRSIC